MAKRRDAHALELFECRECGHTDGASTRAFWDYCPLCGAAVRLAAEKAKEPEPGKFLEQRVNNIAIKVAALEAKAHEHPVMVTVRHDSPCTYGGDAQAEPVGIGGVNYTQGVLSEKVGTCGVLYGLSATDRTNDEG